MNVSKDSFSDIEDLLPRFCEGKTSLEETRLVEKWMSEDADNRRLVQQILALNLAVDAQKFEEESDLDNAFNKVKRRINSSSKAWWNWAIRAAAVLSIPLLFSTVTLYLQRQDQLAQFQIITAHAFPGMRSKVLLPDSTVVYLNAGSTLKYPSRFSESLREVELEGEGYFDVRANRNSKFAVNLKDGISIEVYGTKFNVDAYQIDSMVSATLLEGSIGFAYCGENGKRMLHKLQPNQRLTFQPKDKSLKINGTEGLTETAWIDGQFIFKDTPIREALYILGKHFNVRFTLKQSLNDLSYTGKFTSEPLELILKHFEISTNMRWRYLDDAVDAKKRTIELY